MAHIFEQQPGETSKAYSAFNIYLSLGPQRSLAAAAQRINKHVRVLAVWSQTHNWVARAEAYTGHLAALERDATAATVVGKAGVWRKRQEEIREAEWAVHAKCLAAADKALKSFMDREKVFANLADIARILEVASKLGRMASGLATETIEHTGEDGGPIRIEVEAALKKIYGEPVPGEIVDAQVVGEPAALPAPKEGGAA